jgi:hypothetical protein
MNDDRKNLLLAGALTALLLFVAAFGAWSGSVLSVQKPYNQQDECRGYCFDNKPNVNYVEKSLLQRAVEDPIAFYTLILTIFTGILAISTIFLWVETSKSVKIASRSLTELERSYVFVEGISSDIEEFIEYYRRPHYNRRGGFPKKHPSCKIKLVNNGRITANIVLSTIVSILS